MTDVRQLHYRYRTDTGTVDATPTWGAGEDANYFPGSANFRLRVALRNAAAAATGSQPWELYVSKNGGAYSAVTTSSTNGVQSVDAGSSADDAALLVPRLYPFSSDWQLSGASIDLDFAGGRYYGAALSEVLSISRASDGYAQDLSGNWIQFGSNVLRITDRGLLIEDARTNYLINSGAPVTQTTASLGTGSYTLWVEGTGSALASAGSGTITGAASASSGSPNTFSVTGAGTVVVTVTGTLTLFQLENGAFPSSYIPTGGVSATRAADAVSVTGNLDVTFSGAAVSVVADLTEGDASNDAGFFIYSKSGSSVELVVRNNNTQIECRDDAAHVLVGEAGNSRTWSSGAKGGTCWDASSRSTCMSGGTVTNDAFVGGMSSSGPNRLSPASFTLFRRLTVWDSKIADATLQAHTAP